MLIVDIPSLIVAPFTESEGGREQKVEKGFESGNCIGLSNNRHLRKIFEKINCLANFSLAGKFHDDKT